MDKFLAGIVKCKTAILEKFKNNKIILVWDKLRLFELPVAMLTLWLPVCCIKTPGMFDNPLRSGTDYHLLTPSFMTTECAIDDGISQWPR